MKVIGFSAGSVGREGNVDRMVKAMHSSDLTSGRVEIDWAKAIPVLRENFADGAYVFEVGWDRVAASKKIVDDAIARYW